MTNGYENNGWNNENSDNSYEGNYFSPYGQGGQAENPYDRHDDFYQVAEPLTESTVNPNSAKGDRYNSPGYGDGPGYGDLEL